MQSDSFEEFRASACQRIDEYFGATYPRQKSRTFNIYEIHNTIIQFEVKLKQ